MIVRPLSCSACTRNSPRRRNSRSRRLARPCSYSTRAAPGGPREAKSRPNAPDTHECKGKGFQLPTQPHQKFIQRCQPAAIHHTVRAKLPSRAAQRLNQGRTSRIQVPASVDLPLPLGPINTWIDSGRGVTTARIRAARHALALGCATFFARNASTLGCTNSSLTAASHPQESHWKEWLRSC